MMVVVDSFVLHLTSFSFCSYVLLSRLLEFPWRAAHFTVPTLCFPRLLLTITFFNSCCSRFRSLMTSSAAFDYDLLETAKNWIMYRKTPCNKHNTPNWKLKSFQVYEMVSLHRAVLMIQAVMESTNTKKNNFHKYVNIKKCIILF